MLDINKIYNEDCLKGMRKIDDESIDLIATDVPYLCTSRGNCGTMGGHYKNEKTLKGRIFDNNDIKIEEYLPEFYRVLKQDTHCYIMCNNSNITHFLNVIEQSDFHFTKCLIWDKCTKICGTYYMGQFEYIILIRKGKDKPVNDCSVSDILSYPNKKTKLVDGTNLHDSEKPVSLMRMLVKQSTRENDIVLDPFMGSGTTAIACIKEKRNYFGFEIDKRYYESSLKRIEFEQQKLTLF